MFFCTHLQEFWILVRVRWGSRDFRCRRIHCSNRRSQPPSRPLQTHRSGWCRQRSVHPPLIQSNPVSVRGERKRAQKQVVMTPSELNPQDVRGDNTAVVRLGSSGYGWHSDITHWTNTSPKHLTQDTNCVSPPENWSIIKVYEGYYQTGEGERERDYLTHESHLSSALTDNQDVIKAKSCRPVWTFNSVSLS